MYKNPTGKHALYYRAFRYWNIESPHPWNIFSTGILYNGKSEFTYPLEGNIFLMETYFRSRGCHLYQFLSLSPGCLYGGVHLFSFQIILVHELIFIHVYLFMQPVKTWIPMPGFKKCLFYAYIECCLCNFTSRESNWISSLLHAIINLSK